MTVITPKGWCPTLHEPMPTGDGLLVRVKPPAGILSAAAARTLAEAAIRHGNGIIELTNRASLQIRGLSARTTAPFAAAMVAAGLADADPAIERRRTVIASPLAGDDPGVSRHTTSVTEEVEAMLASQTALAALPAKFGCLVDGGGVLPVSAASADIRIVLDGDACRVTPDGSHLGVACDPEDAADVALQLARAFVEHAAACQNPPQRMRALIAELGAPAVLRRPGTPAVAPRRPFSAVGSLPYQTTTRCAFGLGLPFGAADPATIPALADLSHKYGDGTLRLTPWRAFALAGVTEPDAVRSAARGLNLISDPNDPRTRLFACPGSPACPSATVETRTFAASLSSLRSTGLLPTETLHVSGCAKGCAHPSAADVTLVGEAGRYGIVHDGPAGDTPSCHGMTTQEVIAHLRRRSHMATT